MKRKITADEVRRFFEAANKQFEEAGFNLLRVRFLRMENPETGEMKTDIELSYEEVECQPK